MTLEQAKQQLVCLYDEEIRLERDLADKREEIEDLEEKIAKLEEKDEHPVE